MVVFFVVKLVLFLWKWYQQQPHCIMYGETLMRQWHIVASDILLFALLRRPILQCRVQSWKCSIRLVLQCMLEMYELLTPQCSKIDSEFTATFSKEGSIERSTAFRECINVRFLDSNTANWFEIINFKLLFDRKRNKWDRDGLLMEVLKDCPVISDWFSLSVQTRLQSSKDFSKAKLKLQDLKHGWPSRSVHTKVRL